MVCATCSEGLRLNETGFCEVTELDCDQGYFYNTETLNCDGCGSSCEQCGNNEECQSCPDEIYPFLTTSK